MPPARSARQFSPIRASYRDLSSPDPLGDSSVEEIQAIQAPRRTRSGHSRKSDELEVTLPLSPSKMVTEQNLSPWRIKVTVEAEPEGPEKESGRARTVKKTTKVPLNDENASGGKKTARRSSSPARAQTGRRSRRQSVTDLNLVVLGDDAEDDEWGVKPESSRKRRSVGGRKSGGKRKSGAGTDDFEIAEDGEQGVVSVPSEDISQRIEEGVPELRELDLNQVAAITKQGGGHGKKTEDDKVRQVSASSAMSYPTPSPTASEQGDLDPQSDTREEEEAAGLNTVMESEGFTMIDLNSLPSIRQMRQSPDHPTISERSDTAEKSVAGTVTNEANETSIEAPSIAVTADDTNLSNELPSSPPDGSSKKTYRIGHLQLPSSTNVQRHRLVTPMPMNNNPHASPKLPSPPRAPASIGKDRSPVHSDEAMRAGNVLQDAMTPVPLAAADAHLHRRVSSKDEEALFEGFSSGTRRELRAELRFGEELARKQLQRQPAQAKSVPQAQLQVWRGETTVQHTPRVVTAVGKEVSQDSSSQQLERASSNLAQAAICQPWQQRMQRERDEVIEKAQQAEAVVIGSDCEEGDEEINDGETTMGDIWLAEARHPSFSPRDQNEEQITEIATEHPRRKLIPSPWKRGEQIEPSQISNDDSFSGILWKQSASGSSNGRFGDAMIAHPERAPKPVLFDRRRSAEFDAATMTPKLVHRLSPRHEHEEHEDTDVSRKGVQWRSAEEVIEEETNELEAECKLSESPEHQQEQEAGMTRLYETDLDAVQDPSSSPQIQSKQRQQEGDVDHDSTYSSLSEKSTIEAYRQRVSLSPSKERPNTPRSAMKGGRATFGVALRFDGSDEANARRVMWARRSQCMNEDWEESIRSVKSSQESSLEEPSSLQPKEPQQGIEASFEVQPQPPQQKQQGKGWLGWFQKGNSHNNAGQEARNEGQVPVQAGFANVLDGPSDESSTQSYEEEVSVSADASVRKHLSSDSSVDTQPPPKTKPSMKSQVSNLDGQLSHASSSPDRLPLTSLETPSYLLAPSYPSDPARDASIPLTVSGPFTNTHFRTLHIIYRKSFKPRFHAPAYPDEIRPAVLELVQSRWQLQVDESATMGEDGLFEFTIGGSEARVLERFMQEVERGYELHGMVAAWDWSVEELAERLARIAIGENVRQEEKAVEGILRSAKKVRPLS